MVSRFHKFETLEEAAIASFNSGVDLNSGSAFLKLANSSVNESRIDQALQRLFEARIEVGLFDPYERSPFN